VNFEKECERYLNAGINIIPVRGKVPLVSDWQKWCYEQQEEIILAQNQTGIGLCCGPASEIIAVDIDTDDPEILSKIPYSPVVRKGKKGEVRFFSYSKDIQSRNYHEHKVEILSGGRQVVIPPSIHPETMKPYTWVGQDLLKFGKSNLPALDLSFLTKLKVFEPKESISGRNNYLKKVVTACLGVGKTIEEAAKEVYLYDLNHHKPRLFTDTNEGFHSLNEQEAQTNALIFTMNISKSLFKSKVFVPNFTESVESSPAPGGGFELAECPLPKSGRILDLYDLIRESSYSKGHNITLGSAITIFSSIVGARFIYKDVAANVFTLLIGGSGVGKKFGMNVARKLLGRHGMIGSADFLSVSGVSEIGDHQNLLCLSEEFSKVLKLCSSTSPWQSSIPQDLCRMWSASMDDFSLPAKKGFRDSAKVIQKPFMSILAATTPNEYRKSNSSDNFTSGFVPRFLIFIDEKPSEVVDDLDFKKIDKMLEETRLWADMFIKRANMLGVSVSTRLDTKPEDTQYFSSKMNEISALSQSPQNQDDATLGIINRMREQFKKLALLHCVSNNKGEIDREDMDWSFDVLHANFTNFKHLFVNEGAAENQTENYRARLLKIIASATEVSHRDIINKTKFLKPRVRNELLQDLIDGDEIVRVNRSGKFFYWINRKTH